MSSVSKPLIVQSDRTLLLEVEHPEYEAARAELARFAELVKSPEHIHTYRLTPLSLWNAAAAGLSAEGILGALERFSRYSLPSNVVFEIREQVARYGRLRLVGRGAGYAIECADEALAEEIWTHKELRPLFSARPEPAVLELPAGSRGLVKQSLTRAGYPVDDRAGYVEGAPLEAALRSEVKLRDYQRDAAEAFLAAGAPSAGGSGVIVLPCGAGKTVVGMEVIARLRTHTLILCTGGMALHQWRRELLEKTTIRPEEIGEYSGEAKDLRPVTLATYRILTHRRRKEGDFTHFGLFDRMNWGLIVYDEVHLLPAEVFRATALLQTRRRLGLTATLIREDGLEADVFSLIGPKKYDAPWKDLERQGWIAPTSCVEIRVALLEPERMRYASATDREKFRIASENPAKMDVVHDLLERHAEDRVLVIGQYLDQLDRLAKAYGLPLVTGETRLRERDRLLDSFRSGEIRRLALSKVGNFSIDLPEANVLIQVSGQFGSRQEEAQRLGRVLRPKKDGGAARFYTVVSRGTCEEDFAAHRQLFLTEQGYAYEIVADGALYDPGVGRILQC
ncbi:MAG: DNA repair helicase XPB [Planctomycetota bacterium]